VALLALIFLVGFSLFAGTTLEPETSGTGQVRSVPSGKGRPSLTVVSQKPFVVLGTGFRAGETVRVVVYAKSGTASARDQASSAGRIGVRLRKLKLGACADYVVAASGDKGSSAGLRSIPRACGIDPGRAP
jgi:hypothetical protein